MGDINLPPRHAHRFGQLPRDAMGEITQRSLAARLPFDILEHIFILCLPSDIDVICNPATTQAPMLLCHVCSLWRRAAMTSPYLWRDLFLSSAHVSRFQPTGMLYFLPTRTLDLMHQWLGRASNLPLRVRIHLGEPYDFADPSNGQDLPVDYRPPRKLDFSNLIRHLEVCTDIPSTLAIQHLASPEGFASVETLYLWANDIVDHSSVQVLAPQAIVMPKLRKLFLHNYLQAALDITDIFPWSQLTHLVSECFITGKVWHQILESCPNLTHGMFYLLAAEWVNTNAPIEEVASIPSLERLTIFLISNVATVQDIFFGLRFPSLKSLQFSSSEQDYDVFNWPQISSKLPMLEEIYIGPHINFSETGAFPSFNDFNPNLHTLIIDQSLDREFEVFTIDGICQFLKGRAESPTHATIQKVVLMFPIDDQDQVDPEAFMNLISEELEDLCDEGLELIMQCSGYPYKPMPWPYFMPRWSEGVRHDIIRQYDCI